MNVIDAAACAASELAAVPLDERAAMLDAVAEGLTAERAALVALADRETRLGRTRLDGELTRTAFQLRLFADVVRAGTFLDVQIDRADPEWAPGPRPDLRRYQVPLGPTLVFAASNFPFAFSVAGGDTAAALAAGCPVVVKAHPGHPELSRRVAAIVGSVTRPGVLGLVEGVENGVLALRDERIRAAAFTGSVAGGLALARIAAERPEPIPFYGELGSVNPVVVLPEAAGRPELAAAYVASLTLGAGQFCTNPGLLFVPADSDLVDRIAEALRAVAPVPMLNDAIADGYRAGATRAAALPGARKVVWPDDEDSLAPRLLTMDVEAFRVDPAAAEECFGPLGLVVTYRDPAELPAVIAALPGQLTTSLSPSPEPNSAHWPTSWPRGAAGCCGTSGRPVSRSPQPCSTAARSRRPPRRRRRRSAPPRSTGSCARSPTRAGRRSCCRRRCATTTRGRCRSRSGERVPGQPA